MSTLLRRALAAAALSLLVVSVPAFAQEGVGRSPLWQLGRLTPSAGGRSTPVWAKTNPMIDPDGLRGLGSRGLRNVWAKTGMTIDPDGGKKTGATGGAPNGLGLTTDPQHPNGTLMDPNG